MTNKVQDIAMPVNGKDMVCPPPPIATISGPDTGGLQIQLVTNGGHDIVNNHGIDLKNRRVSGVSTGPMGNHFFFAIPSTN